MGFSLLTLCWTSIGIVAFFTTFKSHYSFNTFVPTFFLLHLHSWWFGLCIRILLDRLVIWRLNNFWLRLVGIGLNTSICQWWCSLHLLLACFTNLFLRLLASFWLKLFERDTPILEVYSLSTVFILGGSF